MKTLSMKEIRLPRSKGEITGGATETDYHTGEDKLGSIKTVICPEKDYTKYLTEYQMQRNSFGDMWNCVSQGHIHCYQVLANLLYKDVLIESVRFLALKSCTKPREGASVNTVSETFKKNGSVLESDCPSMSDTMTEDEFYTPLDPELDKKENILSAGYEIRHEWLSSFPLLGSYNNKADTIIPQLVYSPVIVAIDSSYSFTSDGQLAPKSNYLYGHVVLVVKADTDGGVFVFDSENPTGLMKVHKDYLFGWCKNLYISKKKTMYYKIKNNAAIFLLDPVSKQLEPFLNGDTYKTWNGTTTYNFTEVPDLKSLLAIAPLSDKGLNLVSWDKQSFINSFNQ